MDEDKIKGFLQQKRVFLVGSNSDTTVLVAVHPHYEASTKSLYWWDTEKERIKEVKSSNLSDTVLHIIDIQEDSYFFIPLSLALYNNLVGDKLLARKEFSTEEEMTNAFESTLV